MLLIAHKSLVMVLQLPHIQVIGGQYFMGLIKVTHVRDVWNRHYKWQWTYPHSTELKVRDSMIQLHSHKKQKKLL